jgi:hypothetical protein
MNITTCFWCDDNAEAALRCDLWIPSRCRRPMQSPREKHAT